MFSADSRAILEEKGCFFEEEGTGMTEKEFVQKVRDRGGRAFLVGGWVRDQFRGEVPHDKDYMIAGMAESDFAAQFPEARKVGRSFPVYLVYIDGKEREVAFARREYKAGSGYRGFVVESDPSVTVEEDLFRRDTTMNSLAIELPFGRCLDYYGGREDIRARRIRAISAHFCEDPVRALRAARQAAAFRFSITEETIAFMRSCRDELAQEPQERLLGELKRALQTEKPSVFFEMLRRADLLSVTFPEIAALIGRTQPVAFHPEGDAYCHTMMVVDQVAKDTPSVLARFCGLVHDLGKGTTPRDMEPHHYGHEQRGVAVLQKWNRRMTLPRNWMQGGVFLIQQHMRAPRLTKAGKIVRLLLDAERSVLSLPEFCAVIRADHYSLPIYLERAEEIVERMHTVNGRDCPREIRGHEVGKWLLDRQICVYRDFLAREVSGRNIDKSSESSYN